MPKQANRTPDWDKVRSLFSLDDTIAFFNNGTAGPASNRVSETRAHYDAEIARHPYDPFLFDKVGEVRDSLAAFVNARSDEVFFTHSTTEGMNIFAHGLDWNPDDEVLIAHYEHPGGAHVYRTLEQRRGIRIKWLELPAAPESADQIVEIYRRAFTPRTKLIVVSHVLFVTGVRMPVEELAELAHSNGALISVDGAQAFGLLPLNLAASSVDHYAGSGQKWVLAGTGTGFTYIRKWLQRRVWPVYGFDDIDVPPKYKIGRYEKCGQPNIPAWLGLGAAIELQREIGPANIEARALDLTRQVRLALEKTPGVKLYTPADPRLSAALTTFSIDGVAPEAIVRTLIDDHKIYTRTIVENDVSAVRVSTHFYNTPAEVGRLVESLSRIASRRAAA